MKFFVFSLAALLILASCGLRVKSMQTETEKAADRLNSQFVYAKESVIKLDAFVEELLAHQEKYDLSIDKMDFQNGGRYKLYEKTYYYTYTNDGGAAGLSTGFFPVDDNIKKRLKLFEYATPLMKTLVTNDVMDMLIMDHNHSTALMYPWIDWLSFITVKFDFRNFPWITLANEKNDPGRKYVWLSDPFVILGGGGWIVVCISPVDLNGKFDSVISEDVYLTRIASGILKESKIPLLFVTEKSSVVSANKTAQEKLNIKVLKEFDYVKQMTQNLFIQDEYLLTYKNNPADIRSFGEKLKSHTRFETVINGKTYSVYKKALPELPNLFVVGLVEK